MPARDRRALAIDASEWFQDPAWAGHVGRRHWRRLPARAGLAIEAVLRLCERHGARATWFVPANVARRWPEQLARLARAGHEVAAAGDGGEPAERGEPFAGVDRTRAAIEAATGEQVRGARAAGASMAISREPLHGRGYRYELTGDTAVPFAGEAVPVELVTAWELDAGQPSLRGLPARVRRPHEQRLRGASARLDARLARAGFVPIAERLGLPPAAAVTVAGTDVRADATAPNRRREGVPRLAVVVPLKDEAEGVPSLLVELDALAEDLGDVAALEFVFVDDGSSDATAALLTDAIAALPHARLVRHERNRGVAAAIRTGLLATDAPIAASIDADLSYDARELGRMLPLLDGADVVTASPYHPRGGVRNVPRWRLLLSRTLSLLYRRLLRSDVHTWTSCVRVYRRSAVVDLPQQYGGFLGTAELLVRVLRRGGRVVEHPCVLEARLFGVSKLRALRAIREHLGLLWQVARGRVH